MGASVNNCLSNLFDSAGCCLLYTSYKYGNGCSKNPRRAFLYFKQISEKGYAEAQNNLGECYQQGVGTVSYTHLR